MEGEIMPGNGPRHTPEKEVRGTSACFVSVIIPTYNRRQWLEEILASLAVQSLPFDRFEVIVVDDGSQDETRQVAQQVFPFRLRYFYQTNQGDAAARNLGATQSQAEFLVFFDDDIILEKDFLVHLLAAHENQPQRIIVGTDTLWVEETNPMAGGAVPPRPAPGTLLVEPLPFAEVCSNNMSIRREAYFAVGMMEGLDFPGSSIWCDVDFTYRAAQKNFEFLRSRQALCWHRDYVAKSFENRKKRMREVAYRAVVLFQKYPELVHHLPMFEDKIPVDWKHDGFALIVRKGLRRVMALKVVLGLLEQVWGRVRTGSDRFGEVLGRWIVGGYIFRGYREGLRDFGPVRPTSRPF
jgi:glycosyltransferase involved in cell wall biosynthesis